MKQPTFDFSTVLEHRDRAMLQVAQTAEDRRPNFAEDAASFVRGYLRDHGPTSAEVLTTMCKANGIQPHDDRAFGPVYMRLASAGIIRKVGAAKRFRGHGTAGGNIWALR